MAQLSTTNNYIETLIDAGADAFGNLYVAKFTFNQASPNSDLNVEETQTVLTVRATKVSMADTEHSGEYTVKFITASIPRPSAKVSTTREFTLEFRVDANYLAYETLLKQQTVTSNMAQSYVASNIQDLRDQLFEVSIGTVPEGVTGYYTNMGSLEICKYKNCWVKTITPLAFKQGDSQPLTVSLTCGFLEMEDLQSTGAMYS